DNFDSGRKKWKAWARVAWTTMAWPNRIDEFLEAEGYHPNQIYHAAGSSAASVDAYAPIWDKLASMIFGDDAFLDTPGGQILHPGWQAIVKIILGETINRCSMQWKRTKDQILNITAQADAVMEGKFPHTFLPMLSFTLQP